VRYTNNIGAAAPCTEQTMGTFVAVARDVSVGPLVKPG